MKKHIRTSLIVAMDNDNCIGVDNNLPWHISEDLRRFKELTLGKPIIMGRKTFDSIGRRPLPKRPNIIVSRNKTYRPFGAWATTSFEDAVFHAKKTASTDGVDEIMVIGGAQIYNLAMPLIDRMYITRVDTCVNGDAFFPKFDLGKWKETECIKSKQDDLSYRFITYDRI